MAQACARFSSYTFDFCLFGKFYLILKFPPNTAPLFFCLCSYRLCVCVSYLKMSCLLVISLFNPRPVAFSSICIMIISWMLAFYVVLHFSSLLKHTLITKWFFVVLQFLRLDNFYNAFSINFTKTTLAWIVTILHSVYGTLVITPWMLFVVVLFFLLFFACVFVSLTWW